LDEGAALVGVPLLGAGPEGPPQLPMGLVELGLVEADGPKQGLGEEQGEREAGEHQGSELCGLSQATIARVRTGGSWCCKVVMERGKMRAISAGCQTHPVIPSALHSMHREG
jgi:hypothetical protein